MEGILSNLMPLWTRIPQYIVRIPAWSSWRAENAKFDIPKTNNLIRKSSGAVECILRPFRPHQVQYSPWKANSGRDLVESLIVFVQFKSPTRRRFHTIWALIRWSERPIQLFERSGWHSGDKNGWFGVVLSLVTELVKSWSSKIRLAPEDLKNRQSKLMGSQRKISTTQRTH